MGKLLFNKKQLTISDENLPLLVHGHEGSGASHFSMSLITDLARAGRKVLFTCRFPEAQSVFSKNLEKKLYILTTLEDVNNHKKDQIMVLENGNASLLLRALEKLSDLDERIVFIKNFEEMLTPDIWRRLRNLNAKAILSGNLDLSVLQKTDFFKTRIMFNPTKKIAVDYPKLGKYHGFLVSSEKSGIVTSRI